jgi:alpha-beta hydrolase superfamily lysophospholipase
MRRALALTTIASHQAVRWALRLSLLFLSACLLLALGFTLYAVTALPDLQPWHTTRLKQEFDARRHASLDFAGYLAIESKLFDEAAGVYTGWRDRGDAFAHSRFNAQGAMARLADGAPYNRTFRLSPAAPVGSALLIHGLTDSPYSLRALAEVLYRQGFEVTVLRLPGHGTLPSMLTATHLRDWRAAVAIAARDVAARTPPNRPYYLGGYSTGAALALVHTLTALKDGGRPPTRVLLVSPAIAVTPVAAVANVIDFFAIVPVPVLEKVRWQEVVAEYDPYKFNSFPVNASLQVSRATNLLRAELAEAAAEGRIPGMPPVTAWQSVVDATVGSAPTVDVLFSKLEGAHHRLVLFDINRYFKLASVQRPAARELMERVARGPRSYTLDIVSNASPQTLDIAIHRLVPGQATQTLATGLAWPHDIVSLSHVALPFPPDDPVYGIRPGSGRDGIPSIGSLLVRGESGALTVSLGSLTRLRSNPFWSLIETQVEELVAADTASAATTTAPAAR